MDGCLNFDEYTLSLENAQNIEGGSVLSTMILFVCKSTKVFGHREPFLLSAPYGLIFGGKRVRMRKEFKDLGNIDLNLIFNGVSASSSLNII